MFVSCVCVCVRVCVCVCVCGVCVYGLSGVFILYDELFKCENVLMRSIVVDDSCSESKNLGRSR
jgi:hypothetical protein